MSSRILVTGGAGFIGSFAVRALARAGHEVVVYDNLRQGHREAIDRLNAAAPGRTPIRLVEGDIRDRAALARGAGHAPHRGGDALRRVAAGRRVGQPAGRVLREQRRRRAGRARGDGRREGAGLHLLVDRGDVRRARARADRRRPPAAADQHLRRDQAGRRARPAALRARLRHPLGRAALLQRRRRRPGRDHRRGSPARRCT